MQLAARRSHGMGGGGRAWGTQPAMAHRPRDGPSLQVPARGVGQARKRLFGVEDADGD